MTEYMLVVTAVTLICNQVTVKHHKTHSYDHIYAQSSQCPCKLSVHHKRCLQDKTVLLTTVLATTGTTSSYCSCNENRNINVVGVLPNWQVKCSLTP